MSADTRDILLKAAEDVQKGMWCKGSWFADSLYRSSAWGMGGYLSHAVFTGESDIDEYASKYRCAEGSIMLATGLLGGTSDDYVKARRAVEFTLGDELWAFNDHDLPDDPFLAGQQLAELFRETAETL